jgi:GTP cyclohydrolase II
VNRRSEHKTIGANHSSGRALVQELLGRISAHRAQCGRPFVTLSYAQSLDGCIALDPSTRLTLSCPESLALTHKLRAMHDAILVGVGTVISDNPRLTTRLVEGRDPQPVVIDSSLRMPPSAKLIRNRRLPVIVAAGERADRERQKALEAVGVRVIRLPTDDEGGLKLSHLVEELGQLGLNTVMVEGGARTITGFYSERLVDEIILTIAPVVIGGLRAVHRLQPSYPGSFPRLRRLRFEQINDDIVLWGEPVWERQREPR